LNVRLARPSDSARRPLRILMVAPTSFFSDYGGHIRILEETLALQAAGQQVTIVTYYKGSDLPGLDIRRTRPLPYRAEYEVGSSRHKLAFDLLLGAKVLQVGRQFRPDVVHGHMHEGALLGSLLARRLRVPLVFDFQGGLTGEMVDHGFLDPDGVFYPWVRRLERRICHLPAAILTSSLQAGELLTTEFGVPEARIRPLPDCVDIDRFDPAAIDPVAQAALRSALGIPAGRQVVAYLGLLASYQGTSDLIQAAARSRAEGCNLHFLVMGYPRAREYESEAAAAGVGDMMTFTGKVMYRDAPLYLSLGDLAVSPKVSNTEGSGKVLNYMAMAQPVVAYDTPVHREYLAELGTYVGAGEVEELACQLAALGKDEARRLSLGAALRERAASRYSWAAAGERIIGLYHVLTSRH
jgi:glycosyltransferase involved in cell wall biosynthesis